LIVAIGVALRVAYGATACGLFYPDDIHQTLEPAHGVVYGTGLRYWEFERGARPWTAPGVYIVVLGLLKWLGITDAASYTLVIRLLNALTAATWPLLCYRIGRGVHSERGGLASGFLAAVWYVLIILAPRALSHTFSVTFALWAIARTVEPANAPPHRRALATGALLGLAAAFRYQDGLAAAGVVIFLFAERRRREALLVLAGSTIPLLAVGALDWLTWGGPFHSLVEYLRANVLEDRASGFGRMAWHFYLTRLLALAGPGALVLVLAVFARRRAALLLLSIAGTILLAHSLVGHKELRFVLVAITLLLTVAGCGAATLLDQLAARPGGARPAALVTGLVILLWSAASGARAVSVTFADFGMYSGLPEAAATPWDFRRDLNRALTRVGRARDLCGVSVFPYGPTLVPGQLASTGGYTYLNRGVPLRIGPPPPSMRGLVNYVISCDGAQPGPRFLDLAEVERLGACTIYRHPQPRACTARDLAPFSAQWAWDRPR
jgi:hypothetical protein